MTRPIRARFNAAALRHNFAVARDRAGTARIWSVVKANGYGHGLMRVVEALDDVTDGFALVEVDAAIELRNSGVRKPILMLEGYYHADELPLFAEYRLTPVLHSLAQVRDYCTAALPLRLPVYLKLNTGMNRLGFDGEDFEDALRMLARQPMPVPITLMTHFADADGIGGVAEPVARFASLRAERAMPVSLANSAALLRFPETLGDWVRPGIMLYGSSPFPGLHTAEQLRLKPVMTLASELIAVRTLARGDRVGYGGTFAAPGPMRIGIVACGYADGYPRHAPTGTPVLVAGRRSRTLGRVSMDKLAVDLAGLDGVGVGAEVTLWGEGLPADDVAAAAETISYELFCSVAARVPFQEA